MVLRHKGLMLSLMITHYVGRGWPWQGTSTAAQDTAHRTPGLLSPPEAAYTCCRDLHLAPQHLSVSSSPSLLLMMNPFCEHQPYEHSQSSNRMRLGPPAKPSETVEETAPQLASQTEASQTASACYLVQLLTPEGCWEPGQL